MADVKGEAGAVKGEAGDESITITVKHAANDEVQFKIKKKTKLSKVMDAYCNKQGVDRKSLRFLFDGQRIADDATGIELELEEGDQIEAFAMQVGGLASTQHTHHTLHHTHAHAAPRA
mmetsp:Transcript_84663/g.137256  ORF Transcript_84663/g.137256 Transcript_84663/m.137256 type:complete len:118 (-) Transcript_84663:679-1032(-)|eukprot:CAMPEP_0179427882 /NCGR_PEP_ID=MMETSP0799-20121207/13699_1 /TAXON_ID=46947 /ORGANISM="Geminigera cryophila, Strain CCMP2564" /LENGTH=117 /DNA_ID=CAMNT_0021203111 /DNA_START=210 /DNA_END=563 /DNA_ORIENTATION=-